MGLRAPEEVVQLPPLHHKHPAQARLQHQRSLLTGALVEAPLAQGRIRCQVRGQVRGQIRGRSLGRGVEARPPGNHLRRSILDFLRAVFK